MHEDPAGGSWHLDRRVPLALIVTIVLQTGGLIWWASQLSARVDTLERQQTISEPQRDRLTRVEVRIDSIADSINRIEALIRHPMRQ